MNKILKSALALAGIALSTQAAATITFYENEGFGGRNFTSSKEIRDFQRIGFNDRASSVVVTAGERWEACEDAGFGGRCVVLRAGQYGSLAAMGLNDHISSVRMVARNARVDENRYSPPPVAAHDYRRRNDERVFEAQVTSARAVMGPPEQRCWVEREQVSSSGQANVPGALVGAVIGGILGHQVGSGRGNTVATAGGAVAGAALGANVGRDNGAPGYGPTHNVQRCSNVASQTPAYWDVTYDFHGQEHHVQMAQDPGRSVNVNSQGEPRA